MSEIDPETLLEIHKLISDVDAETRVQTEAITNIKESIKDIKRNMPSKDKVRALNDDVNRFKNIIYGIILALFLTALKVFLGGGP